MNLSVRFRKKETIADRHIAGESFLIPICGQPGEMEKIFILNPLADFIWLRLDGRHTLEAILADIIENFAVKREQARQDEDEFILHLLEHGLIEEVA
jgi:hypothetical protein